jgi:hypothetical protein
VLPPYHLAQNGARLTAALTASAPLAWLRQLTLHADLALRVSIDS